MPQHVVFFAHGQESGPWGTKISRLAEIARSKGLQVESPDYSSTQDPDQRVAMLKQLKPAAQGKLIFYGSSMGGYVSAAASSELKPDGLFLLAPAFYIDSYPQQAPYPDAAAVEIVHGWRDDVVPVENSIRYAGTYKVNLHLLNSDHRLTEALPFIEQLFIQFLDRVLS